MNTMWAKIFISGYPQGHDELALLQLVSLYGEVSTIKVVRGKQSGKTKGYKLVVAQSSLFSFKPEEEEPGTKTYTIKQEWVLRPEGCKKAAGGDEAGEEKGGEEFH